VELSDGRWLFIYTHFEGGASDHAAAHLAARASRDGGATWSAADTIVLPNEGTMNVMSVSLLRLADGRIALLYLRKHSLADCRPYLRLSTDEARSWGPPVQIIPDSEVGYYVVNNDRLVQLSSGRLVMPTALHSAGDPPDFTPYGRVMCYLSDDGGTTWRRGARAEVAQDAEGQAAMVQEPGVVELTDGRLMMFCRTDAGTQFLAYSHDGGEAWSPLQPSTLASPRSPASVKRIPQTGDLLLAWNNHAHVAEELAGKRTPLTLAISGDDGTSWQYIRNLEVNPHGWYCYTAIAFTEDHVLLAYCAGDTRYTMGLATLQITRVPIVELCSA
jgi:hypothetical protein